MDQPSAFAARRSSTLFRLSDGAHPNVAAVVLVLIAFAIRFAMDPLLGDRSPFLLFTAAIVIAAGRYGIAAGVISCLLSLVLGTAVFLAPGFPPDLSANEATSLAVFIITGASMLTFAGHLKHSREREQQLASALQQQRTDAAMGSMAATLAHELNQPLAAASNYVGACKRLAADLQGELRNTVLAGLGDAEAQIGRAGDIIRHARDMVSNASVAKERTSLSASINNVVKPLRASGICETADLHVSVELDADSVFVNPIQIEQVLMNLIRNACQAAGSGDARDIFVSGTSTEGSTLIEVRDLGTGISQERITTLFSPQARPRGGGLGLGLPISRTIVEAHGGRIWAENNSPRGASFFFTIPREAAKS